MGNYKVFFVLLIVFYSSGVLAGRTGLNGYEFGYNLGSPFVQEYQFGFMRHYKNVTEVALANYDVFGGFAHIVLEGYGGIWSLGGKLTANYTVCKNDKLFGLDVAGKYFGVKNNSFYLGGSYTWILSRFTIGADFNFKRQKNATLLFGLNFSVPGYPRWFW